jgi:transposase
MNTTPIPTATAAPILALDLGKYKSVACVYDAATAQANFTTVRTTQDEIDHLLSQHPSAVVVIEACTVSGWVHDLCQSRQLTCVVANTSGDAWKFIHTKRKTDKDDALRLAQLYALKQLPAVATYF